MLDIENLSITRDFLDLVFNFDGTKKVSKCLPQSEAVNMIIEKSNYYWNIAEPKKGDKNLEMARQILSVAPKECSPLFDQQLRILDALDLAIELGCKIMPVKFRFLDREDLFGQIVNIKSNYKKVSL